MSSEYELISFPDTNYKFSMVNILYCAPHVHKEWEICLLLDGAVRVFSQNRNIQMQKGDIWVINPFKSHELTSSIPDKHALIVELQIPTSFFHAYYPRMENTEFEFQRFDTALSDDYRNLMKNMIDMAINYFSKEKYYELICAGQINLFFKSLLNILPHQVITEKEKLSAKKTADRIYEITKYIEENYSKKLLLSEIAQKENLSLNYLSHFFKNFFGMPFQEYLMRIRCENARQLLLSDASLLDISIACGFSDPKYFNKGFRKIYGCFPKEYRKYVRHAKPLLNQNSSHTAHRFLEPEECLKILRAPVI